MKTLSDNDLIVMSLLIQYYCLDELEELEITCINIGLLVLIEDLLKIAESKYYLENCDKEKIDFIIEAFGNLKEGISKAMAEVTLLAENNDFN